LVLIDWFLSVVSGPGINPEAHNTDYVNSDVLSGLAIILSFKDGTNSLIGLSREHFGDDRLPMNNKLRF
jgi:hypothetical protein